MHCGLLNIRELVPERGQANHRSFVIRQVSGFALPFSQSASSKHKVAQEPFRAIVNNQVLKPLQMPLVLHRNMQG